MKKIFLILFILISLPLYVNANVIPANEEGIVIVPKNKSADLKEHQLVSISNDAAASIQSANGATTFSTFNYRDGYFDHTPSNMYTVNQISAINNNINDHIGTISPTPGNSFRATFSEPINIKGFYLNSSNNGVVIVRFYSGGVLINTFTTNIHAFYYAHIVEDVDRIDIFTRTSNIYFRELELFVGVEIDYIATSNVKVYDIEETAANVSFTAPESKHYKESEILINGESFYKGTDTVVLLENLKSNTNYEVIIRSYYTDGNYVDTKTTFKTAKDTIPPGDVLNLTAKQVGNTIVLNWTKPPDKDFSHVKITRNGMLLADGIKNETYTDVSPVLNADNVYRVIAFDEGNNFSSGASVTEKFIGSEVYNLQAKAASHEKVDLSWKNPQRDDFETVRIARKDPNDGILSGMMSFFSSGAGYKDLFQTNGTIFNDLTVSADTQYTYLLQTVLAGEESDGVTIDVKTPKVTVGGGSTGVSPDDPNSYIIKWTTPTKGQMKILIGGKEYKTVPASDKQIIVPAADMVFDILGKPAVKLVPIDEKGKEGEPTSTGGGTSNGGGIGDIVGGGIAGSVLNPSNLLEAGVGLLAVVGAFVLLGLSFMVVPKLIRLIRVAFDARRARGNVGGGE